MTRGPIVSRDPETHGGDIVFSGTRVPVSTLLDHLTEGATLDDFLEGYPTVERWQAVGFLTLALAGARQSLGLPR